MPARLDHALASSGLVESRQRAQALIASGRVRVDGVVERRPERPVGPGAQLDVEADQGWASRGALKLGPALDAFGVAVAGRICADVGASTGGFTDVLLRRGAQRVYAVDVGRGLLHSRLAADARVVVMDRVNARDLESWPEPVSLVTVDVSFIGLEKVLPAIARSARGAEIVTLFKPQFQVARSEIGKRGVVRDAAAVAAALARFRDWCAAAGFTVLGEEPSQVPGPEGNREIFCRLRAPA